MASPQRREAASTGKGRQSRSSGTETPLVWTDKRRAEELQGAPMSPAAPRVSFSLVQSQTPVPRVQHNRFSCGMAGEELTSIALKRG